MNGSCLIRHYAAADRQAVRDICCETAVLGKPIDTVFPDREVFADSVIRYYTDYEPQTLWVAESGGRIVGYASGCLDSRRYRRIVAREILPKALLRGLMQGVLLQPGAWRLLGAGIMTLRLGNLPGRELLKPYPAHLHVNLREGFRGQGLGSQLINALEAQLAASGAGGLHAAVRSDNEPVCRLFERLGFAVLCRQPIVWPENGLLKRHERVVYAKRLTAAVIG